MSKQLPSLRPVLLAIVVVIVGLSVYFQVRKPKTQFNAYTSTPNPFAVAPTQTSPSQIAAQIAEIRRLGNSNLPDDFHALEKFTKAANPTLRNESIAAMGFMSTPEHRAWIEKFLAQPGSDPREREIANMARFRMMKPEEAVASIQTVLSNPASDPMAVRESVRKIRQLCPANRFDLFDSAVANQSAPPVLIAIAFELAVHPDRKALALLDRIEAKSKAPSKVFDQIRAQIGSPNNPNPCAHRKPLKTSK